REINPAALADSLDMLSSGIFLIDATGRIVHANRSGRTMLWEANIVGGRGGSLSAIDPRANQALLDAFTAAGAEPASGRTGVAVPLEARDGGRYVANVMPLPPDVQRKAGGPGAALALVFCQKAALDLTSLPEAIAKEYGLAPAELRVLFAIIEVGSVRRVAKALGSSEANVKVHLQQLFKKTGTTRQAELVRLVADHFSR